LIFQLNNRTLNQQKRLAMRAFFYVIYSRFVLDDWWILDEPL